MGEPVGVRVLLDDLPVAAALVAPGGSITAVNAAAAARYGWRHPEDAVGLPASVLAEGLADRLGGEPWRGELLAAHGESGSRPVAIQTGPVHDEDGNVIGCVVVCTDASRRADAEQAAQRLARLQAVTARLGAARGTDDVAAVVCDDAAAGVGAHAAAFFRLVDDGDTLQLVRQVGFGAGLSDRYGSFPADASLPATDALRSRNVVILADPADRAARYPSLDAATPFQAHVAVPLVHDERPLGVAVFGLRRAWDVDDDSRRFLLAVAAQAAQALDRIRATEQERTARRRQEFLARATGVLAGSLEHEAATAAVGRLAVQDFADSFSLQLDEGGLLRNVVAVNADAELEELTAEALPTPAGAAIVRFLDELVGTGRSILSPVLDADAWPALVGEDAATILRTLDVGSAVVTGLHARGRRLGVLAVTRRRDREPFDQEAFLLVSELAGRLSAAVDAALAHQGRAEVARTLQASLLPPRLPEIPGVEVASRYDPVGDGSLVGGDFYDVFPSGEGRWCLVLGDVCGQGVPAAALTSLVRYTVRAAARLWESPADILRFTNDAILDNATDDRFCTLLVCMLRPDGTGATVTLAAGGHHLPLHAAAGRPPVPVGRVGTALGLVHDPDVWDTTVELAEGDVLVLTTDGVIEARDPEGRLVPDRFLEDLVQAHAPDGAEAVAAAVERAVLAVGGGRAVDDVALLAVAVTAPTPPSLGVADATVVEGPFDRRYPVDVASVTDARRAVAAWLEANGIDGHRVPDALLALTELATNAVRSARTAIEVRTWLTGDTVVLEVTDDGPGFEVAIPQDPRQLDPLAEGGRGLFLATALVDDWAIESGPNGTIVRVFVSR